MALELTRDLCMAFTFDWTVDYHGCGVLLWLSRGYAHKINTLDPLGRATIPLYHEPLQILRMERLMQITWKLGFPGWQIAAKIGFTMRVKIHVCLDQESNTYIAYSNDIGLAVESDTLDGLLVEVRHALPCLLEFAHTPPNNTETDLRFHGNLAAA